MRAPEKSQEQSTDFCKNICREIKAILPIHFVLAWVDVVNMADCMDIC